MAETRLSLAPEQSVCACAPGISRSSAGLGAVQSSLLRCKALPASRTLCIIVGAVHPQGVFVFFFSFFFVRL